MTQHSKSHRIIRDQLRGSPCLRPPASARIPEDGGWPAGPSPLARPLEVHGQGGTYVGAMRLKLAHTPQAIQQNLRTWIGLKEVLNLACNLSGLDSPRGGARGNRVGGAPAKTTMPPIIPRYLAGVSETPSLPTLSRYPTTLVGPQFSFFHAPVLVLGRWLLRLNIQFSVRVTLRGIDRFHVGHGAKCVHAWIAHDACN